MIILIWSLAVNMSKVSVWHVTHCMLRVAWDTLCIPKPLAAIKTFSCSHVAHFSSPEIQRWVQQRRRRHASQHEPSLSHQPGAAWSDCSPFWRLLPVGPQIRLHRKLPACRSELWIRDAGGDSVKSSQMKNKQANCDVYFWDFKSKVRLLFKMAECGVSWTETQSSWKKFGKTFLNNV